MSRNDPKPPAIIIDHMSMDHRKSKKRSSDAPPRKEKRDSVKSSVRNRSTESIMKKGTNSSETRVISTHKVLDIPLNADTARQAVILSEIIGKPVSKRRKRW